MDADETANDVAHLVIFDRRPERTWEERIWQQEEQHAGLSVTGWGM